MPYILIKESVHSFRIWTMLACTAFLITPAGAVTISIETFKDNTVVRIGTRVE